MERLSENPRDLLMPSGQLRASTAGIHTESSVTRYVNLYFQSFPGRFDLYLEPEAASVLADLLRTKGQGEAGPLFVGPSHFPKTGRHVVTLTYKMGVPGEFRILLGDDDAQRLANELEAAVQRVQ